MSDSPTSLIERIDAWLPQTQCGQCGFAGCRPYAEAIACGEADINQCPPGGEVSINALAALLGMPPKPLSAVHGQHRPRLLAVIDEATCIGCTLCIKACPVDAILGARKQMHTVIVTECTGCELCLPPCPVDCITLIPHAANGQHAPWPDYAPEEVERARRRAQARRLRLQRRNRARRDAPLAPPPENSAQAKALIAAAVERARRKKRAQSG